MLEKAMAGVLDNTLHTDVLPVALAVELEGLIMQGAEFMVFANLLLLAGELKHNEVFTEHVWFDLGIVLETTGRAVQELFLFEDDAQALLANCVPAV